MAASGCDSAVPFGERYRRFFRDKAQIEANLSKLMQELRDSNKAEGADRIYTHGEKEFEAKQNVIANGISVNEKTYAEMQMIAEYTGAADFLPAPIA